MKDGKSLPVFTAQRGTETSGYQIITSNNSKKTKQNKKKPWKKLNARVPAAAPLGRRGDGSRWDELPVHILCVGCMWGSGQDTALVALGTLEQHQACLPLAASGQVLLSPTEVAAELFSHRIHYGGILGKRGRAAVGRVGVSSRAEGLLCAGRSMRIRGTAAADLSSIPKITVHPCRMVSQGCLWPP